MQANHAATHGYGDFEVDLRMVLVNKNGKSTERRLAIAQLEVSPELTKTLISFAAPKSIRGTGLLTFSAKDRDAMQWIYLPKFNRVKRISARDRSGSFAQSTFSYEDLTDFRVDEFDYRWEGTTTCGSLQCDVVLRTPKDPYSGYAYQRLWVDDSIHQIRSMELYDTDRELQKVMQAEDFRAYALPSGVVYFPTSVTMQNVQTGRATTLIWGEHKFARGLTEQRNFSENALRRVR
ncbi:MAG: outer membrane lipoprotein-sorting protein [Pseudomonadota bacterium]